MDNRRKIIDYIERCYQSYLGRQSDVMFNAATNELFDLICDISVCKDIIASVKKIRPISNGLLKHNQATEYFNYVDNITQGTECYVSYCLHWYDYIRNMKGIHSPQGYDQECNWLNSNIRGSNDTMMLFKTDFVRPILNYIIEKLNDEIYLLYVLERFKQRVERFRTINVTSLTKELDLQKELFLYLFDQGLEIGNSTNIGNGEVDFIIDINGSPFIIEAKFYKKGKSIKKYLSQLKDYMDKVSAKWGCLYIFTMEDVFFKLQTDSNSVFVKTIYVGNEKPSNRKTRYIVIT